MKTPDWFTEETGDYMRRDNWQDAAYLAEQDSGRYQDSDSRDYFAPVNGGER